jgi:bacillithiol system protein YtxJ
METVFTPITTEDALEQAIAQSWADPVVLYKHDPECSISAAAYQELAQLAHPVALVDVAHHAPIAQVIAARTAIPHASPQVIILRRGHGVWTASLREITRPTVADALQQAVAGDATPTETTPEIGGDDAATGRALGEDPATGGSTGTERGR